MPRIPAALLLALAAAVRAPAQQSSPSPSPLEPMQYGVVYDVPGTAKVMARLDLPYSEDANGKLAFDLYLPPEAKSDGKGGSKSVRKWPTVVFLNAIGDRPGTPPAEKLKRWGIYRTWPRLVAAHGLAGIAMDADPDHVQQSLASLFAHLEKQGGELGVDATRIGVYAASANVDGACEYLLGGHAAAGIRAAVLYYGGPPQRTLRSDLPVFFLVAESDAPRMTLELAQLWQRVVRERAPWTLLFASGMPHAFDAFADNDEARRLVQQTIAFWKSHLEPVPEPPWEPSPAREIVAAMFANDSRAAAAGLKEWIGDHPDDGIAHAMHGRILAELGRFKEAAVAYERALALGQTGPDLYAGLGFVRSGEARWVEAADLLGRAVAAGLRDSRLLGSLGYAQLMSGKVEEGVRSYEQALEVGIPPGATTRGLACFNLACGYARLGRKEPALAKLSMAIDEGFKERKSFEGDADLASLKGDPRFQQLLARLDAR